MFTYTWVRQSCGYQPDHVMRVRSAFVETYEATNAVLLRPLNSPFVRPTCPFREIRWQYVTTLNLEPKVGRMSGTWPLYHSANGELIYLNNSF